MGRPCRRVPVVVVAGRRPVDAMRGVRDVVDEAVVDMREVGETAPESLADRRYSGKVFLRTSPELHRRLTIEAAEQGVSINQWATQKLAERHAPETLAAWGGARLGEVTLHLPESLESLEYDRESRAIRLSGGGDLTGTVVRAYVLDPTGETTVIRAGETSETLNASDDDVSNVPPDN